MLTKELSFDYRGMPVVTVSELSDDILLLKQWVIHPHYRRGYLTLKSYMEFTKPTKRHKFQLSKGWGFEDKRGMPLVEGLPELPEEVRAAVRECLVDHYKSAEISTETH